MGLRGPERQLAKHRQSNCKAGVRPAWKRKRHRLPGSQSQVKLSMRSKIAEQLQHPDCYWSSPHHVHHVLFAVLAAPAAPLLGSILGECLRSARLGRHGHIVGARFVSLVAARRQHKGNCRECAESGDDR